MFEPLTWALVALSLAATVFAIVLAARDKRINWTLLGLLGVIEIGLLAQLVVGIVQLAGTERDVSGAVLRRVPGRLADRACRWARCGRSRRAVGGAPARWLFACLVIPVLELRLHEIWTT